MGKFVLTEHLPSSVSQYLLPSGADGSSDSASSSNHKTDHHGPSSCSSPHHKRSSSEPTKLLTDFDPHGGGNASEGNGTSATASDEELSSVCPEENVEVIHSLRIGGSDGRLSPSFAPTLSSGNSIEQKQKQQKNGSSGLAFFSGHSSRSSTRSADPAAIPTSNDDSNPSPVQLTVNNHQQTMSLKLDRYGFIKNLDSKGHVLESYEDGSVHGQTFAETQRTERREKKWTGMLQGLEGRKGNSSKKDNERSGSNGGVRPNRGPRSKTTKNTTAGADNSKSDTKKAPPSTASSLPRPNMAINRTKNQKQMIRRLRKGIPDSMRGRVWSVLGGGIRVPGLYQDIVQHTSDAMLDNFKHIQQSQDQKERSDNQLLKNEAMIDEAPGSASGGDNSPRPNTSSTVSTDASSHDEATSSASTPSSQTQTDNRKGRNKNGTGQGRDVTSSKKGHSPATRGSNDDKDFVRTRQFRSIQDTIERDIHRTYPRHILFYEEERYAQDTGAGLGTDVDGTVSSPSASSQNNTSSASNNTTTVMLASPTETETLIASGFCDPDMAALILNLERDIRMATMGETSAPVRPSDGAAYTSTPGGQAALRRVLRAYSYYDQEVGYCQGMNFIAGMFLTLMSEEEAFWLLVAIMHNEPCKMRGMFGEGMKETHKVLYVGEKLMHHYLPRLARHFDKEHIHVTMFATQWLLTLYTSSFRFDLVFRTWDAFLGEGWKIIYRVMLALLQKYQNQLMKMSFEEILTFFRELPDRVEGSQIMDMALKIPLRRKVIAKYEKDWTQQQQNQQSG